MSFDRVVCPGCASHTADRIDVRTVERAGEFLVCACGRRYPIVDGVPIVMADPAAYLAREIATVVERELAPEVAAALALGGPDDAPYARLLEHLSIYLDAHWGDRADPVPDGAAFGARAIVERLAGCAQVEHAVELGCSVGRIVGELARTADHVVGIDLHFGTVRRARRLLDGAPLAYNRRMVGRHYVTARVAAGDRAAPNATLLCGDVLAPPLVPQMFDRVVALNMLDSVANPQQLLAVMHGLCAPGGELILSSPYAWQSAVMAEHERLGGPDPATTVVGILRDGALGTRYRIEDEADLPWALRRDARSTLTYRIHYVRARKLAA